MRSPENQMTVLLKFLLIIHNHVNVWTVWIVASLDGISGSWIQTREPLLIQNGFARTFATRGDGWNSGKGSLKTTTVPLFLLVAEPYGNKIWLSMHPRNFLVVTKWSVSSSLLPVHVSGCEMSHLLAWSPRRTQSVLNLILDIHIVVNWQLLQWVIRLPVSHDCIAGLKIFKNFPQFTGLLLAYGENWTTFEIYLLKDPARASLLALAKSIYYCLL